MDRALRYRSFRNINLADEEKAKKSQTIPRGRVIHYNDETVPQNHHLHVMEQERDPREIFPDHTPDNSPRHGPDLFFSLRRLATRRSPHSLRDGREEFSDPYDVMLRDICEGVNDRPKGAVCLSVEPGIFNHHRPVGPSAYHSDISEHLAAPVEVAFHGKYSIQCTSRTGELCYWVDRFGRPMAG